MSAIQLIAWCLSVVLMLLCIWQATIVFFSVNEMHRRATGLVRSVERFQEQIPETTHAPDIDLAQTDAMLSSRGSSAYTGCLVIVCSSVLALLAILVLPLVGKRRGAASE